MLDVFAWGLVVISVPVIVLGAAVSIKLMWQLLRN